MKKALITFTVIFSTIATLFTHDAQAQVKGWILKGSYPEGYTIGVEADAERNGHVAFLKSIKPIKGYKFGTIMQNFIPEDYLGKRVRLTGYIKTADVKTWAAMWFRIDGDPREKTLGFDNMQNRAIKGTTGWQKYEIVLEVPTDSKYIAYGVLLDGTGSVWLDNLSFEVVSKDVPETNLLGKHKPENTNFEEN
jgi:hypothetical protein